MEPVFTLAYPEYAVAIEFSKYFKKSEGYSLLVPLSRQQKGFDLILFNQESRKAATIQVKGSRTYPGEAPKTKTKRDIYRYNTWFNTFPIQENYADYYVLFGLYWLMDKTMSISKCYSHVLLILNRNEMSDFLNKLVTRKGKPESKFGFGFNRPEDIFLTRGSKENEPRSLSKFLFSGRVEEIRKELSN
jgi:hypothetical protein